jgi:hypothetical protein
MKKMLMIGLLATLPGSAFGAQDVSGDWRGTLKAGPAELRLVLHVMKTESGLSATLDSVDQGAKGIPVEAVTLEGTAFKFVVDKVQGKYEGTLSADGASIKGTWSQGQPLALDFEKGNFNKPEPKRGKPSDIDGAWSGALVLGDKTLRVVYHIVNTEEGLAASMDVPDQGAKGLPVSAVTRTDATLKMEMKGQAAVFEGKISADLATISGTLTQMGKDLPLVLTKSKGAE